MYRKSDDNSDGGLKICIRQTGFEIWPLSVTIDNVWWVLLLQTFGQVNDPLNSILWKSVLNKISNYKPQDTWSSSFFKIWLSVSEIQPDYSLYMNTWEWELILPKNPTRIDLTKTKINQKCRIKDGDSDAGLKIGIRLIVFEIWLWRRWPLTMFGSKHEG